MSCKKASGAPFYFEFERRLMMEKERQHFYRQMLAIAIPVSLQTLLTSFLNTLDTIMISSLGDGSIAVWGLQTKCFFYSR